MSVEDKTILRNLQRAITKREALDVSDARIGCAKGVITIGGIVRPATGFISVKPKEELRFILDDIARDPSVRDVAIQCRFEQSPKK
jgi:hypothetical protein